jgi:predicted RNA-binding Zn ribbon-like protein
MDEDRSADDRFLFVGNAAWLDFVNTEIMSGGEGVDLLDDFGDLVEWLSAARLVSAAEAKAARERWAAMAEGRRVLESARRFRSVLRSTAERLAAGHRVADDAVAAVNDVLARPAHATAIRRDGHGFVRADRWHFAAAADVLAPVAESARDLLCDGDLSLVRKCRNPDCILFFYDTTKNHGRAWCSMSACGNRTKVAAHYRRRREARG